MLPVIKNPVGLWEMILLPISCAFRTSSSAKGWHTLCRTSSSCRTSRMAMASCTTALGHAFPWFNRSISKPLTFDMAKAKQLISQSGVKTPII